ncbi:D-alanyl-D-alanine carboxypeptidase [Oscillatoria sp. FACHB-1407]|uniref:D-alanyl-D-alanine carboxypeptidase n=1 Tax=Oscillatoria sp. FACHB-1407 TaxID=2692847 RepID=UPI001688E1A8|nr:D-alanyl-D-alanine carboxypeptidase [Oscillatoria sp. FACHB-1407]MBD2466000.1 D-alanyl-D-alanine carboxypeptidase [Oscillatoria sp. FACHB-1407]
MFELLASGFLSLWLDGGEVKLLKATDWSQWLNADWIASIGQPKSAPDPTAIAAVQQHLNRLINLQMPTAQQGVWIQVSNQILAENQGNIPLSAASLTKIATTLVALETWGVDHEFETLVGATGIVEGGVIQGDLVIQGGGDPFFVWEEAIALGNALNQMGINRVAGNLIIAGDFAMNFQTDPVVAGELLRQGLNADLWNAEANAQYQTLPSGTARPRVVVEGLVQVMELEEAKRRANVSLIRHRSLPLVEILKAQNVYSNNVMSDLLAEQLGGAEIVARKAAERARVPAEEVQLINGSGLGMENRISPKAVCAMLVAIQQDLEPHQLNVADLFPVIGRERGTLGGRRIPTGAAVKTGTLDAVSALAGAFPTRDRGLVWFAIINVGTADLQALHDEQDLLLQTLQQQWGAPTPLPTEITPSDRASQPGNQLGAPSRNEVL